MPPLVWSVLLMFLGVVLLVLEAFIPSGGALGFLSIVSVIASVALTFYYYDPLVGATFLATAVFGLPLVLSVALKWWPHSPLGRLVLNMPPENDDESDEEPTSPYAELVGKRGHCYSPMRPSGVVEIESRRYDAVSEGMAIEVDQEVRVVEVSGNRIVVRPDDGDQPEGEQSTQSDDEILSQPIENLGIDPLDDPLA